jgi:hypothetical protein
MDRVVPGRRLRSVGLATALTAVLWAVLATNASAAGLPLTSLGCANPANHGLAGRVLGAVGVRVGGQLRCFGDAVAHGHGLGPQIMAGPTGYGPTQIQ